MRLFKTLFLLSLAFFFLSGKPVATDFFSIRFLQDGKEIPLKGNTIELKKKPFTIEFTFPAPLGVFVNASFDEQSYKLAKKKKNYSQIPGFISTGMAESELNKNKEILVCDKAPSYWYYESENVSRFDETIKDNGALICKRSVEQLYLVDKKETLSIDKVGKTLYLVFLVKERGKNSDADIELQRESRMIRWK